MVKILCVGVWTLGLAAGQASEVRADPVCVCVTVRSIVVNEVTTGYQCQPGPTPTWTFERRVGPEEVVYVTVQARVPLG